VKALTRSDLRCPKSGKRAYVDEETALEHVEKAWTTENWNPEHGAMPVRAYRCEDCGWWHMTARPATRPHDVARRESR